MIFTCKILRTIHKNGMLRTMKEISDKFQMCLMKSDQFEYFFRALENLSLRGNPFTEIPRAVQDIPTLRTFDMSYTQITEIQPNSLAYNKKLETIIFQGLSYLYVIHSCAFCGLKSLKVSSYINLNSDFLQFI